MSENTAVVKSEMNGNESVFFSMANFEGAQRMAKMLAESDIVPDQYKKSIPNTVIALEMANRIGASPLAVMQNLYIVYGKPAWSSQFLISCINASGRFSPLRYKMDGGGDEHGCIAWATDKTNERLESPRVTIGMAKAEGWFQKNGSKWKTMPDLMLRYRAATLFARLYAPELTMGIHTDDEVIDITPVVTETPMMRKKSLLECPQKTEALPELEPGKLPAESKPGTKPETDIAALFEGKHVTFQQTESFFKKTGKLGMTMSLEKNPTLCGYVRNNLDKVIDNVVDFMGKEKGGE